MYVVDNHFFLIFDSDLLRLAYEYYIFFFCITDFERGDYKFDTNICNIIGTTIYLHIM